MYDLTSIESTVRGCSMFVPVLQFLSEVKIFFYLHLFKYHGPSNKIPKFLKVVLRRKKNELGKLNIRDMASSTLETVQLCTTADKTTVAWKINKNIFAPMASDYASMETCH